MKVLCFGSLNIDYTYRLPHFVKKGETIKSYDLMVSNGGKGMNQAIALARAGANVWHAGAIGEDGKFLLDILKEEGVNTEHILVSSEVRTGNAIIQNDSEGDNCIIIYAGANEAITQEHVDQVIEDVAAGDYVVLQNEINNIPYIMKKAHEKGAKIFFNPSPMEEKISQFPLELVDVFFVNEIEAAAIIGLDSYTDVSIEELKERLKAAFPKAAIVLTLGAEGAYYFDGAQEVFQPSFSVRVVDTTAAGDTFSGYFIKEIMDNKSVQEALLTAAKAASITVTRPGAGKSIPTQEEVKN